MYEIDFHNILEHTWVSASHACFEQFNKVFSKNILLNRFLNRYYLETKNCLLVIQNSLLGSDVSPSIMSFISSFLLKYVCRCCFTFEFILMNTTSNNDYFRIYDCK